MAQTFLNNVHGELLSAVSPLANELDVALYNLPPNFFHVWGGYYPETPSDAFTLTLFTVDEYGEKDIEIVVVSEIIRDDGTYDFYDSEDEENPRDPEAPYARRVLLGVYRGCEGTEPVPHPAGSGVESRLTAAALKGMALYYDPTPVRNFADLAGAVMLVPSARDISYSSSNDLYDSWVKAEGQWLDLPDGVRELEFPLASQYEYVYAPFGATQPDHPNTDVVKIGTMMYDDSWAGMTKGSGDPSFVYIPRKGGTGGSELHRDVSMNGNVLDVRAIPRYTPREDAWSFKQKMFWRLYVTVDTAPWAYCIQVDNGSKQQLYGFEAQVTSIQHEGYWGASVFTFDDATTPIKVFRGWYHFDPLPFTDANMPTGSKLRSCVATQDALTLVYESEPTVARVYRYDIDESSDELVGLTLAYAYDFGVPVRKVGIMTVGEFRAMLMLAEGDDALHVYDARGGIGGIYLGVETEVQNVPAVVHDFHGGRAATAVIEVDADPHDLGYTSKRLYRLTEGTQSNKLGCEFVDISFGVHDSVREMGHDANVLMLTDSATVNSNSQTVRVQTLRNAVKLPAFPELNQMGMDVYLRLDDAPTPMPMPAFPQGYPLEDVPDYGGDGGDGGDGGPILA